MVDQLKYQIALTMVKGVGPLTARKLVSALGDVPSIFKTPLRQLEAIPGVGHTLALQIKEDGLIARAERELQFLDKVGGRLLFFSDADFPQRLKECEDHPILLYAKGKMNLNEQRVLGVVGTRKMTAYGRTQVEDILSDLRSKFPDLLVVSGLAYGVDGCAHRKSVELGLQTVGVVGHGLDMIYPAEHRGLAERMMQKGGVLTEYHSHCLVNRKNFVSRNRIIAGVSDVILVVESGEKGGALLTAEFANSYNREVCAIPGRVNDVYSEGCNQLIKTNKAAMVECAQDIIDLMNWERNKEEKDPIQLSLFMDLSERERLVVQALEIEGKMQLNALSRKLQMPVGELSSILFEMEMKDLVVSEPGGVYGLR